MVMRVLESLWDAGVDRVVVIIAPHDHELRELCARLPHVVVREQSEPLGSGDALLVCKQDLHEPFYVSACDSLVSQQHIRSLGSIFESDKAAAVVSILEVAPEVSLEARSVVRLEGNRVVDLIEKPRPEQRCSNSMALPLYVLSPKIFRELAQVPPSSRGEYELPAALRQMIMRGDKVLACRAPWRHDLTDVRDLLALNRIFLEGATPQVQIHESVNIPGSVQVTPPVIIEQGCSVGEGASIGPMVYLERGVKVAPGVHLRDSVVTRDSFVQVDLDSTVYVGEGV
jgi:bifunctional UDP-N-acetylglucosamine pyrophosphorylase/glucosamine-1-phosphate N-acetyltransferase